MTSSRSCRHFPPVLLASIALGSLALVAFFQAGSYYLGQQYHSVLRSTIHGNVDIKAGYENVLTNNEREEVSGAQCLGTVVAHSLIIGDWGGYGRPPYRTALSSAIGKAAGHVGRDLRIVSVFSPGDAFYPHGVHSVKDRRFHDTFEVQFNHSSLHVPWFLALGNHDYEGKLQPFMDYSKVSRRWNLPDLYYSKIFRLNIAKGVSVTYQVLFLDTNRLVRQFMRLPKRDVDQWQWISDQLNRSTADWLFVVGHHPVYSVSERGTNAILVKELLPLMNRHGVALYFSGHDHDLQHIRSEQPAMDMFVVGAGSYTVFSTAHEYWESYTYEDDSWKFVPDQQHFSSENDSPDLHGAFAQFCRSSLSASWVAEKVKTVPLDFVKFHQGGHAKGGFASLSVSQCVASVKIYSVPAHSARPTADITYSYSVMNPRQLPACCKSWTGSQGDDGT